MTRYKCNTSSVNFSFLTKLCESEFCVHELETSSVRSTNFIVLIVNLHIVGLFALDNVFTMINVPRCAAKDDIKRSAARGDGVLGIFMII